MRCSEIIAAVEAAITTCPVGGVAAAAGTTGARDTWSVVEAGQLDLEAAPDRTCQVRLVTTPARSERNIPADRYQVELEILAYYQHTPDVHRRIGDDWEHLAQALEGIPLTEADLHQLSLRPLSVLVSERAVITGVTCVVEYRLTAGV